MLLHHALQAAKLLSRCQVLPWQAGNFPAERLVAVSADCCINLNL
jgi:hypothetical protein